MVVCLFLRVARRILRVAAAARPNGHRRRRKKSAVVVHRDVSHAHRRTATLRRTGGEAATRALRPHRLSLLRRQSRAVLAIPHARHRAGDRGARVLCLAQRIQPVRHRGVLVFHGGPVHRGAGQAAVRLYRCRRHGRRPFGTDHHDRVVGAARCRQSLDRRRDPARTGGVLRLPAGARGNGSSGLARNEASSAAPPSRRCRS